MAKEGTGWGILAKLTSEFLQKLYTAERNMEVQKPGLAEKSSGSLGRLWSMRESVNGIIQHEVLCGWSLSLSIRFIHVSTAHSLLLLNNVPLYGSNVLIDPLFQFLLVFDHRFLYLRLRNEPLGFAKRQSERDTWPWRPQAELLHHVPGRRVHPPVRTTSL